VIGASQSNFTSLSINEFPKNNKIINAIKRSFFAKRFVKKLAAREITIQDNGMNRNPKTFERIKNMFKLN